MITNNYPNYNNYKPAFGAKLGWRIVYELKNTPEKLTKITQQLKDMGEPTTVVDIMSTNTKDGKRYSLRLFNEVFGDRDNVSLLKDKYNKDMVCSSAKDFINAIENLTRKSVENKEYIIFNKIRNEHLGSWPMIKYLKGIIRRAKEDGKYLSSKTEQTFFKEFL